MIKRTVIIDDDPTGCQTVRDVPVCFKWDRNTVCRMLEEHESFFILTDTRAMDRTGAGMVSEDVASSIESAASGRFDVRILSRSDSTLRGHLMEEILPLEKHFGPYDGVILVPAFFEGDRYTIANTHYVRCADGMIPADRTEFAADPVFGYSTSYLPAWIEEVSGGYFRKEDAEAVDSETIRNGTEAVASLLGTVSGFRPVIVNAVNYDDLRTVYDAVRRAETHGKKFLFRTAASMVRVCLGQDPSPLYIPEKQGHRKGLVVVGSYTGKTTGQLGYLASRHPEITVIGLETDRIFSGDIQDYSKQAASMVDAVLAHGSCILHTERKYCAGGKCERPEAVSKSIADFIVSVCRTVRTVPDFIIAKGGITSLTVARDALGAGIAFVKGQVAPGVPIWEMPQESRFPGMDYVVFPGNVGNMETLSDVVDLFI